jgi:hypothetical protein
MSGSVDLLERSHAPPAGQPVGCDHRNGDSQSVAERWAWCRVWLPCARYRCPCCGGPHTRPLELCAACDREIGG